jgi:large subunit ribosomal protein L24
MLQVDIEVPQYMVSETDTDKRPVRTIEQPVPIDKVRLVFPLIDRETGVTRDVIVKKLVSGKIRVDRVTGKRKWARIIPGLKIAVPWPKIEPKQHKDCAVDTLRAEVESKTFVPTLFRPPFPSTVIDELRNKYSKFRTRHDPEYVAAKMKEDELKEEKKKLAEEMRTPLKEINRKLRKMKKAKGKGELTVAMLEKLGQIIATKRQVALDAAGMEKVEPVPETIAA